MPAKPNKRGGDRDSTYLGDFRRMIVIVIQNLENKMELQINSLETMIEKMQEMFNKHLEEIKKSLWRKRNTPILLVGMQTGTATTKNSMEIP